IRSLRRIWLGARRDEGAYPPEVCERGATTPQAKYGATLQAAGLFAPDFVARSLQTADGYARRSCLVWHKNLLPRTHAYWSSKSMLISESCLWLSRCAWFSTSESHKDSLFHRLSLAGSSRCPLQSGLSYSDPVPVSQTRAQFRSGRSPASRRRGPGCKARDLRHRKT